MRLKDYNNFYSGTSNIVLPVPNKSYFPPEYQDKSRLHYYASLFNSLEVNSSFYKIPQARTIERWALDVPADFRFSFKLFKGITHCKELMYDKADIAKFMQAVDHAGDRKGCLLIQFPASIKMSLFQRFRRLLEDVATQAGEWKLAIEFRDKSWYNDTVYELLERHKAAVVIQDMPKSLTPYIDMESTFVYQRFHGEKGDYRGSYRDDLLDEHAMYMKEWLDDGKEVYVYFNNSLGEAVQNLMTLNGF